MLTQKVNSKWKNSIGDERRRAQDRGDYVRSTRVIEALRRAGGGSLAGVMNLQKPGKLETEPVERL